MVYAFIAAAVITMIILILAFIDLYARRNWHWMEGVAAVLFVVVSGPIWIPAAALYGLFWGLGWIGSRIGMFMDRVLP